MRLVKSFLWAERSASCSSRCTDCWRVLISYDLRTSSWSLSSRKRLLLASCSISKRFKSSTFLWRLVLTECVSWAISAPSSSSSLSLTSNVSFSVSSLPSSPLNYELRSCSKFKSFWRFLLTTVLSEETSCNFALNSSACLSYSRSLRATSLFSWVAFSSSAKTILSRFIKLIFSPSKACNCSLKLAYASATYLLRP
jgi:hypothetical protein